MCFKWGPSAVSAMRSVMSRLLAASVPLCGYLLQGLLCAVAVRRNGEQVESLVDLGC